MGALGSSSSPARRPALVFAGDEAFAQAIAVALHSTLTKLSTAVHPEIFVLDNGISQRSRVRLAEVVQAAGCAETVHWLHVPARRLEHLASSRYPVSSFSRLLIPELMPPHVARAVYLDSDVLVRRDLSPLFTVDLAGTPLGAVRDFGINTSPDEKPYFNGGVLVIDVTKWRSEGLADRLLEYAAAPREPLRFGDQDALNAVVEGWRDLGHIWNVQQFQLALTHRRMPADRLLADYSYRRRWWLYRKAAILHFAGPNPWEPWCATPGTLAWVGALMRSGWYSRTEGFVWLLRWLRERSRAWPGPEWRATHSPLAARTPQQ